MPPPSYDTKQPFCVAGEGGHAPPPPCTIKLCFGHKTSVLRRVRGGGMPPPPRDTKPPFCVGEEGGHAPPLPRHKATVLCRVRWARRRSHPPETQSHRFVSGQAGPGAHPSSRQYLNLEGSST